MFTKKEFRAFRAEARRKFRWLEDITYYVGSDVMDVLVLRSNTDQAPTTDEAHYHLFLDQGYYECHLETQVGPHRFIGMLCDDSDPADYADEREAYGGWDFVEKNFSHFNEILALCDEYGCYPCHVHFYYPIRKITIVTGEDSRISQVISRLKVSHKDSPRQIARKANLINRAISRENGSKHIFAFEVDYYHYEYVPGKFDINKDFYSLLFQHFTDAGVCAGYFAVVDDGVEVEVEARKWDYEAEQRKYENHEPPYARP